MKKFSVIIPSRNVDNLLACVGRIRELGETCEIVFVADGDAHKDIQFWASRPELFPLEIVPGVKPFIFARNINAGIAQCGDDDVILMNDDALVEKNSDFDFLYRNLWADAPGVTGPLSALAWAAGCDERFGVVSAAVSKTPLQPVPYVDALECPANLRTIAMPVGVASYRLAPAMPFICVFIPRRVLEQVGPLDERFTGWTPTEPAICQQCGYDSTTLARPGDVLRCGQCRQPVHFQGEEIYGGEDDDYCYRVRNHGYRLGVYDGCVVDHGTLPSTFRPGNVGRSVKGARAKFFQIHGFAMGAK